MTYGELKASVATRAIRSDLTALIPEFIRRAHDVIVRAVIVSTDITVEDQALPVDCREVVGVWVRGDRFGYPLIASPERCFDGAGSGLPVIYRADAGLLYIAPSPTDTFGGEIKYRLARAFFANDAATNRVLTNNPAVYEYGALAELFRHTRHGEQATLYETLFRDEMQQINRCDAALSGQLQTASGIAQ